MKVMSKLFALIFSLSALAFLPGCDEGPMEEAGENVDDAVDDTGDAVEDAGDEVSDEF